MIQVDSAQDQREACENSVLKILPPRGDQCNEIWIYPFYKRDLYNWSSVAEPWVKIVKGMKEMEM